MAEIVLGVGTSHTPLLSTPPEHWLDHAVRDHSYPLFDWNGARLDFSELAKQNNGKLRALISIDAMRDHFSRSESALGVIRKALKDAAPDVCVVIGDDQEEMFGHDNMPSFGIYYGSEIVCRKPDWSSKPVALQMSAWGYYTDEPSVYPGHAKLALHLIDHLLDAGFDPAASSTQPGGLGMSHAYTFLYRRLLDRSVPIVPVFINTYYPPNQPRAARVVEFGRALRDALDRYPDDVKVAVIASGGLSHFLVNETLDRSALDAMCSGQLSPLEKLPESALKSGNSEIKNWAAAASIMAPEKMELIDYIPAYRSEAGTGCGIAFGIWKV
jgi:3-O-methylgallate 3,4-dioxygenase